MKYYNVPSNRVQETTNKNTVCMIPRKQQCRPLIARSEDLRAKASTIDVIIPTVAGPIMHITESFLEGGYGKESNLT